jgi:hypothetical protein
MKHARAIFAAMLMILPSLAAAQLSSDTRIVAQVPFEFVAGNKVVPAGQCTVQSAAQSGTTLMTLMIRNVGASISLFSPASRIDAKEAAHSYTLVFNKTGNQYFLRGIRIEGTRSMYRLPENKAEAELRAQSVPTTEEVVLASLK